MGGEGLVCGEGGGGEGEDLRGVHRGGFVPPMIMCLRGPCGDLRHVFLRVCLGRFSRCG